MYVSAASRQQEFYLGHKPCAPLLGPSPSFEWLASRASKGIPEPQSLLNLTENPHDNH